MWRRNRHSVTAAKQDALENRTPHPEWPEQTVLSGSRGVEQRAGKGERGDDKEGHAQMQAKF